MEYGPPQCRCRVGGRLLCYGCGGAGRRSCTLILLIRVRLCNTLLSLHLCTVQQVGAGEQCCPLGRA